MIYLVILLWLVSLGGDAYSLRGKRLTMNNQPWAIRLRYTLLGVFSWMMLTDYQADFSAPSIWILIILWLATLAKVPARQRSVIPQQRET